MYVTYLQRVFFYFYETMNFPKDPADLYIAPLLSLTKNISYYITPYFQYYGVINFNEHTLIIGPTYQLPPSRSQIREFMFLLGIQENYYVHYQILLIIIITMPLDIFLLT